MSVHRLPPIAVVAPYPEGAIAALGRHWSESGHLAAMYTPSRRFARTMSHVSSLARRDGLSKRLSRGLTAISPTVEVAPHLELLRLAGRLGVPIAPFVQMESMKRTFDRVVSRKITSTPQIVVGMPGACRETFSTHPNLHRVFHEVDAHPQAHNAALLQHYKPEEVSNELYSSRLIDTIQQELSLADTVLVPSTIVATQMLEHGIPARRLLRVPYGVDFSTFAPIRLEHDVNESARPNLLYVGQISNRKGIRFLLDAVRGQNVNLRLVGPVVKQELIQDLPSNVQYLGVLPHPDVNRALAMADAFVFPSIEDACPLAVIEAAGAGLPIIATTTTGSAELLDPADVTLVEPGSSQQLRAAIKLVSPLKFDERAERSLRQRDRASSGEIRDWVGYAVAVSEGLETAWLQSTKQLAQDSPETSDGSRGMDHA